MKLIIVESPHKCETISKFLGPNYTVMASKGHIRDLATKGGTMNLGIDIDDDFKPIYEVSKEKTSTVTSLKRAKSKADEVYLATDPDREGEAISYHLAKVLNLDIDKTKRLEFHEITKTAIKKALLNPRTIDIPLVQSQETRRIIDRLMGFRLSALLQRKIKSQSAGRVQSVVLKFIVEREEEIEKFIPEEYWEINGSFFKGKEMPFKAKLSSYNDKKISLHSEREADDVLNALPNEFIVKALTTSQFKKESKPPFITSTMQQESFSRFHFSTKKTQALAQMLYEGVEINGQSTGLITYMRTDSIRLSDEFVYAANEYIKNNFGEKYLGRKKNQKASKNVQDAHEAIRPTDINLTPKSVKEYLSTDQYKLYKLIYERTLASLMAAKVDEITTVVLQGNGYGFTATSSINIFDGYSKVYGECEEKEHVQLPKDIKQGDTFLLKEKEKSQHFTKAPVRYNEGKLVKLMQENGIGRPSTYASTITTLLDREYVTSDKGSLIPTEQGKLTVKNLEEHFAKYMDVSYTAKMERDLDDIALNTCDRSKLLHEFWDEFSSLYSQANDSMEKIQPKIVEGRVCPECGKPLVYRKGRYGTFIGCSDYPKCHYIEKEEKKEVEVIQDRVCPECGSPLVKRNGKKGEFIGCSNFPKCHYMEDLDGNRITKEEKKEVIIPEDAPLCPRCHKGHLIEKKSRYGKTFMACSNFPKCRYIQNDDKKE